eukprot:6197550-Pleurochrysis_carterae.AAC.3
MARASAARPNLSECAGQQQQLARLDHCDAERIQRRAASRPDSVLKNNCKCEAARLPANLTRDRAAHRRLGHKRCEVLILNRNDEL